MSDDQRAVIAFLSSPLAYDLTNTNVERCETHGAIVFLADNYAYKLKRAVIFPYMDYSTSTRRRAMCEAELAVNRALAPEIYIEVRPVTRDAAGAFRIGKPGEAAGAVDWLVVMRRFDQDALFDNLCRHSAITGDLVRLLARRIASFHQGAEINTRHGGVRGISAVIDECVKIFREMEGAPFEGPRIEIFANLARAALVRCYDYLESRRKDGHVRRCHGDLHLGNICLIHGEPVPFDAIEFDDEFSCIDVLYDLAFLLMDLEQRDLAVEANALLNHYLARTGDYRGLDALPVFLACRAAIRAHVTIAAAKLKDGQISPTQTRNASQLLELSIRYLEPVAVELIAVGGLSGTGKSNLAIALAPRIGRRPGAILVRTDALRKNLWGTEEGEGLPEAAYSVQFSQKVYGALDERCALILSTGHSAIADGVFGQIRERDNIEAVARTAGARFRGFWLQGPVDVLERRIENCRGDISDATVAVLHRQIATVESPVNWNVIPAEGSPAEIFSLATRTLDRCL